MEDDLKKNKKMEDNLKKKLKWKTTSISFEKLKWRHQKNGRQPKNKWKTTLKKKEDNIKKRKTTSKIKWKMNQSTTINIIGCDTIVNSPSFVCYPYIIPLLTRPLFYIQFDTNLINFLPCQKSEKGFSFWHFRNIILFSGNLGILSISLQSCK